MGKYEAEGQYLHYGQYSNCLKGSVFDFTISLMASTSHTQTKFPAEINESFLVDLMRAMRKCDVSLTFLFSKLEVLIFLLHFVNKDYRYRSSNTCSLLLRQTITRTFPLHPVSDLAGMSHTQQGHKQNHRTQAFVLLQSWYQ